MQYKCRAISSLAPTTHTVGHVQRGAWSADLLSRYYSDVRQAYIHVHSPHATMRVHASVVKRALPASHTPHKHQPRSERCTLAIFAAGPRQGFHLQPPRSTLRLRLLPLGDTLWCTPHTPSRDVGACARRSRPRSKSGLRQPVY